jgi:hypothetical protein
VQLIVTCHRFFYIIITTLARMGPSGLCAIDDWTGR